MITIKINENLNVKRLNHMKKDEDIFEEKLAHFKKIKRRWSVADVVIKYSGFLTVFLTSSLTVFFMKHPNLISSDVIASISILGIAIGFFTESFTIGYTSRKNDFR